MSRVGERAEALAGQGVPFVHARVVLAERPTSAHPGDEALILPDGTMEGFVGGECAEATVRAQALAALDSGEPVLLRITPTPEGPAAGKVVAHNPCLSGGTLEIFLQPRRPPPRVAVFGDGPIASALHTIGRALGYDVVEATGDLPDSLAAVVVASHGRNEATVLAAALAAGVDYVGLVASPKRGSAVVAELAAPDAERIVTPAGLDIGARTAAEVALSIFADVVARRARPSARPPREAPRTAAATEDDPVCGMEVPTVDSSLHLDHDGTRYWFCGSGCLRAFAAEPVRYRSG